MKKILNFAQHLVVSIFQAAIATLIILAIIMAMTSCSSSKQAYNSRHKLSNVNTQYYVWE